MEQLRKSNHSRKPEQVWAESVDSDPWWPCILALDGGGIKGYSSLLILKELMRMIGDWEHYYSSIDSHADQERFKVAENRTDFSSNTVNSKPSTVSGGSDTPCSPRRPHASQENKYLPCHYFDFMYGNSTGGLIATILGRLRMSVDEGLDLYRDVGQRLFGKRRSHVPFMTKYYHQPLEDAVRETVGSRCSEHEACNGVHMHPWPHVCVRKDEAPPGTLDVHKPRICHSCCLAAADDTGQPTWLLRSYPLQYGPDTPVWIKRYNSGACSLPIHLTTRATTAAPLFFKMVEADIDGNRVKFKDGAIRENNPSGAAYDEFIALYKEKTREPALLLSIGTGMPDRSETGFTSSKILLLRKLLDKLALMKNIKDGVTDCEEQHRQMLINAKGEESWYKRLNVSTGMEKMALDNWRRGEWRDPVTQRVKVVPGGKSLSLMEEHTVAYLERDRISAFDTYAAPKDKLHQVAQKLVLHRRARERLGGERWETYIGKHPP